MMSFGAIAFLPIAFDLNKSTGTTVTQSAFAYFSIMHRLDEFNLKVLPHSR
jgi:hypothetical protein